VAVDLNDAAVDHGVFEVGIFGQGSEHKIECDSLYPSAEPLEHRVPLVEFVGRIAPWTARSGDSQHCFQEQARGGDGATGITFPAKTVWALNAHSVSINAMRIKAASHSETPNHSSANFGIFKRREPLARSSLTVMISDVVAALFGFSQTRLGTSMPLGAITSLRPGRS
jgi:hypothetical protein